MTRLQPRLLGLLTTLGLIAFVIGTPALLVAIDATPTFDAFGWEVLSTPDDGTLALAVIALVAWAAWLMMTASLAGEVVARLRGVRAPRIRGFEIPQLAAGRLVATASLLFMAAPLGAPSFDAAPIEAVSFPATLTPGPAPEAHRAPTQKTVAQNPIVDQPTVQYVTRRGDSLWKIAQHHLGDGRRYVEIVALNRDIINGRPDFIPVGVTLRLPVDRTAATTTDGSTYVVEPGDTLSEIAEAALGDPMRYPEIFDASRDTIQRDGDQLTDPDLIRPGWTVTIPDTKAVERVTPADPPVTAPQGPPPAMVEPGLPTDRVKESPPPDGTTANEADVDDVQVPGWVLPGLTGGGAVLAGGLLLVVRDHRRTQLRCRRPGQAIAPPPSGLIPLEKTMHVAGTPIASKIENVDALLCGLRANVERIPALNSVELSDEGVTLHLVEASALPPPWVGTGQTWTALFGAEVASKPDEPAPYPLLVTVGQGDDGHLWLVNLEQLQSIEVVGEAPMVEAFARHVTAELALNPWSTRVKIDAVGIADELEPLSYRLTHHELGDTAFLADIERYLAADNRFDGDDPETFHAVITTVAPDPWSAVQDLIAKHPWRAGAVLIAVKTAGDSGAVALHLADGRVRIPSLNLDVIACGLTDDEAAACAAIVELTRHGESAPVPVSGEDSGELESLIDAAGAVRSDLTDQRPAGPAGEESLLPLASADYEIDSAASVEDVERLAPITPLDTRRRIMDADPTLDADLAAWRDREVRLPKLTLLGPVSARAYGDPRIAAKRKPFYVELLAFLTLHPGGVSSHQVADAFSLTVARARNDLSIVRSWLGEARPTGEPHLPAAGRNGNYAVHGVLSDLDLFRRLRARGQARGSDGMDDLVSALSLVTGEPFSDLREIGWSWLLEGERLDHVATCAVVDVGHLVTTHALAVNDLDLARASAERAYLAAPYDDISRLDLVQVAAVTGHAEIAERHLVDGIFNRSDDDYGPIDLPERTAKIVKQRGWDKPRRRAQS
jgi:nucleoid-associated protein YgaU